jgi:hypothetical protein
MYIKLTNGTPTTYSIGQLKRDNPQVSFPKDITNTLLEEYNVYPVTPTVAPVTSKTEVVEDAGYIQYADNSWGQAWRVRPMNADELVALAEEQDQQRKAAYQAEADPLFFKSQRGEATHQEWLDKVAEIKTRYPVVGE